MPIVEVTYRPGIPTETLRALAAQLPNEVSVAVASEVEPYDGNLQPGDVEVRFRELGPMDVSGMDVVVEIRSKLAVDRERDAQARIDRLCTRLVEITRLHRVGVYLTMPAAVWSQT
ncbi:hypothetical protein M1247_07365 [Mycobacterium sp. 21AC1]|uniref:hypothetical protein n=1 Tax=[Mycobacterium] appelbergii TaxID=2939269 RepID=UPI002938FCD7|nr:hypothetical protein [Mycobacterium sp. 21AC1]MDV3124727.1 hypothetical protein [Mycobacterium sp. 21AC1]